MEKAAKRRKIEMPVRTYTAHVMTMDLFLRKVQPGAEFQIPYPHLWPKGFITTYKIPTDVQTFLFSPFNVIHHPNYIFDNDKDRVRYVIPMAPEGTTDKKFMNLHKHTKLVDPINPKRYIKELRAVEKKVDKIWKNALKLLVFYDYTLAPLAVRERAILLHKLSRETVDWPLIQIRETVNRNRKDPNVWPHYSSKTYLGLLKQIERMENATR
jgi:hypothetical protein